MVFVLQGMVERHRLSEIEDILTHVPLTWTEFKHLIFEKMILEARLARRITAVSDALKSVSHMESTRLNRELSNNPASRQGRSFLYTAGMRRDTRLRLARLLDQYVLNCERAIVSAMSHYDSVANREGQIPFSTAQLSTWNSEIPRQVVTIQAPHIAASPLPTTISWKVDPVLLDTQRGHPGTKHATPDPEGYLADGENSSEESVSPPCQLSQHQRRVISQTNVRRRRHQLLHQDNPRVDVSQQPPILNMVSPGSVPGDQDRAVLERINQSGYNRVSAITRYLDSCRTRNS